MTARAELGWSAEGWFGAQVGSTLWLLIAAAVLLPQSAVVGLGVLLLWIAANGAGLALWRRRAALPPPRAYRLLVLVVAGSALAALALIHQSGHWEAVQIGGRVSPGATYALLGVLTTGLLLLLPRRAARSG
jgi:hypothetical protein